MTEAVLAPRLPARFRVERLLRRGLGISTWFGTDLDRGAPVALKTAPAATASAAVLRRLEREAQRTRDLGRERLLSVIGRGEEDGVYFVALPWVPGVSLAERLGAGRLSIAEGLAVARDLCATLSEIHEVNSVHGDVKPNNVIVAASGPVVGATLIDFGLSRSALAPQGGDEDLAGTALYMAPEQAGLIGRGSDARSDLYAVGLTLFTCLTGSHPLSRALGGEDAPRPPTLNEVLRAHLTMTAPSLGTLRPDAPQALVEVVRRLLQKDPRDRYQTAAGALADIQALIRARDSGVADPALVVGREDRRAILAEPAFVGRTLELATLSVAIERAASGLGGVARLEAPSGGGKSRMLEEIYQRGLGRDAWVLQTRGVEHSAEVPYRAFHDLVEGVVAAAHADPALAARLRAGLAEHAPALVAALPQLGSLFSADLASGEDAHVEVRTVLGLAALLGVLGTRERPVLILVDDAQWTPSQTLRAFAEWLADERWKPRHTLVVMAFRSEEVAPDHPLRALPAVASVRLPPFSGGETRRLAESMAGALPTDAAEVVARLSEGNAFLAVAVLQGLIEAGALVQGASGWTVEPHALASVQASRRAATLLSRRLSQIGEATRAPLVAGAVLGRRFDADLAARLAGCAPWDATRAFGDARDRQIVWLSGDGGECTFVHDRLREGLLDGLGADERRALHRAAAELLEREPKPDVFAIAYHFDEAGEPVRALGHALAAADRARAQADFETATRYYRIAERAPELDAATRRRVSEALGDLALVGGRYDEAASYLATAVDATVDTLDKAHVQAKLGYLGHRRGDWRRATSNAFERALELCGHPVPRTRVGWVVAFLWALIVQVCHSLVPRVMVGRREAGTAKASGDLLAVDIYCRLTHQYIMNRGPVAALVAHLRALNLAERYPPTWQRAYAMVNHGLFMSTLPWRTRAYRFAEAATEMQRALGDPWHLGMVLQLQAVVYQWTARIADATPVIIEAAQLLRQVGDRWEAEVTDCLLAACYYRSGRLRDAIELGRKTFFSSRLGGSDTALVHALAYWTKSSGGDVAEPLVREAEHRAGAQPHIAETAYQADAVRLLHAGRPRDALAVLERAAALVRRYKLRSDLVAPIPSWMATALRTLAASETEPAARERLVAAAWKAARRARRVAKSFENNLPHALRELGLVATLRGDLRRARRWLDESVVAAERLGAEHERLTTLAARADLDAGLGAPTARATAEQAREALRVLREGPPVAAASGELERETLSLADRFGAILESGRRVVSTFDSAEVAKRAVDAARRLLRVDACVFARCEPDGTLVPLAGDASARLSRHMIDEALRRGEPVTFAEASDADGGGVDASESLILSRARSVLCVPVSVRGGPGHVLYLMSTQVRALFREDDLRLASFVATLAGAALENAAGFARVEEAEREIRFLSASVGRAQEEERRRLALALHDGAGQMLASAVIQLAEVSRLAREPDAKGKVGEVSALLRELLEELRNLTHDLRPATLDRLGLVAALHELAERTTGDGLEVEVRIEPRDLAPSLPTDTALALFRIAQAALGNVLRHARAGRAVLALVEDPGELRLEVRDDGVGFDARQGNGGIGLLGMRERTSWIGGTFSLETAPDEGTTITVTLPTARPSGAKVA